MNLLPVTSDLQVLELVYALYPHLSSQQLSFSNCTDISLGLIETNGLKAVLSVQPKLLNNDTTIITLYRINIKGSHESKAFVCLEPLQQMCLRFAGSRAVLDAVPVMLPEETPYYSLLQLLVIGRLEVALAEMDIFYLDINERAVTGKLTALLKLRGYHHARGMYSKYLLMTNTVDVLP